MKRLFSKRSTLALAALCLGSILAACGGGSDTSTPVTNTLVATTATYQVAYNPGATTATVGKTTFTIKVTKKTTGDNVVGAIISLAPVMHMTGMTHTTPTDNVIVENGNGLYTATAYFTMAPTGSDYWELKIIVNGETATLTPPVAPASAANSVRGTLKGQNDNVASMTGPTHRSYYVFRDKLTGIAASRTFGVFLAANDNSTNMPQLQIGTVLHNESGTAWPVDNVVVRASTDNGATWISGTNTSGARWEFTNLASLASGTAGHVFVQLFVNNEQKTTDGSAVSVTNGYADFTVTP